jgi:hypothetical protein
MMSIVIPFLLEEERSGSELEHEEEDADEEHEDS